MLNNPLLWYTVALFAPISIPWEHRDWRYFEECQVISENKDWEGGDNYLIVKSFYPDAADLPFTLYVHPPKGWVVAHSELIYFFPSDEKPLRPEFFQCGNIGPSEWRAQVFDYWGNAFPGHPFYIKIWMLRTKETEEQKACGGDPGSGTYVTTN